GLKKFTGYAMTPEVHHYLAPRQSSFTLITPEQSTLATSIVAQKLAPDVPKKSFILLLLLGFFLVSLVGNRLFCNHFLRKPEMTYPIFLFCSLAYFVGVYYFGWQVEDQGIKRLEMSFVYVPPTGDQWVAHTSEAVISGMAQAFQNIKLPPESFIYPQSIEDVEVYYRRNTIGSKASGEFENLQEGVIRSSYLRPNVISGFAVERVIPKTAEFKAYFKNLTQDDSKSYESSSHDPYSYDNNSILLNDTKIELILTTSQKIENLDFVLAYKERYFSIASPSVLGNGKFLLSFEHSKIPNENNYCYNYNNNNNTFNDYLTAILKTSRKRYFVEREASSKIMGISFQEIQQTALDQGQFPEDLHYPLAKKWNLNFVEQEIKIKKRNLLEWVLTLKNKKTEKSEDFLIQRDTELQMLNVYQARVLEMDPICRLFVVEKTPETPLPEISALGILTQPRTDNIRSSLWYPVIYILPVEVPKEFLK
ncbi:MAG: hypothetical protein AABZ60_13100, partial [Planctomycetota bacterium]